MKTEIYFKKVEVGDFYSKIEVTTYLDGIEWVDPFYMEFDDNPNGLYPVIQGKENEKLEEDEIIIFEKINKKLKIFEVEYNPEYHYINL